MEFPKRNVRLEHTLKLELNPVQSARLAATLKQAQHPVHCAVTESKSACPHLSPNILLKFDPTLETSISNYLFSLSISYSFD